MRRSIGAAVVAAVLFGPGCDKGAGPPRTASTECATDPLLERLLRQYEFQAEEERRKVPATEPCYLHQMIERRYGLWGDHLIDEAGFNMLVTVGDAYKSTLAPRFNALAAAMDAGKAAMQARSEECR